MSLGAELVDSYENSEHQYLIYLFKNADRDIINKTNAKGEILHMAMAIDNPNIIVDCMNSVDINALNNKNNFRYIMVLVWKINNVLSSINNNADLFLKNNEHKTPLVVNSQKINKWE